jgi:hypothetical protein
VHLKPVSKQDFDPNFFGGDAVVKPPRIHVGTALSDHPHPQFLGLSEEKSRGS